MTDPIDQIQCAPQHLTMDIANLSRRMFTSATLLSCCLGGAASASPATGIEGLWSTGSGGGVVRVARCGDAYCGTLVNARILSTQPDSRDLRNPDPALRTRPLRGIVVLRNFRGSANRWTGGPLYDPESGSSAKTGTLTLLPDGRLQVQGCVAIFCKTKIWTRR